MSQLNIIGESKNQINRASYLDPKETSLFSISSSKEYFFGGSTKDVIEVGIYNSQKIRRPFQRIPNRVGVVRRSRRGHLRP